MICLFMNMKNKVEYILHFDNNKVSLYQINKHN